MNRWWYSVIFSFFLILCLWRESYSSQSITIEHPQSATIMRVLNGEKNEVHRSRIAEIINRIDDTYVGLYDKLLNGKKLRIFFDPAHGLLPDGRWQGGEATHRLSCTNLPEEFYSIIISRMMYGLLKNNRFIEVGSTDDFMNVLEGKSEIYHDIPFTTTVQLADKSRAFIIISEHLNNISVLYKADGRINLPGIHITRNRYGWRVLQYVKDTYSGFLTLYNRLDASGFSMDYALNLKKKLVAEGFRPNSWNFGAVGDTRFCYFVDFPVSIIYESGFISNPEEEKKLRDPEYIKKIVHAQYSSLIETIQKAFGVDISGSTVRKTDEISNDRIDLLKLARVAVYYIKTGNSSSAVRVIRAMEKKYPGAKYSQYTDFYTHIKNSLALSCRYYDIARRYKRRKHYKTAGRYLLKARQALHTAPIFSALREKYHRELPDTGGLKPSQTIKPVPASLKRPKPASIAVRAPLFRRIIFPIEENRGLEASIWLALDPGPKKIEKLVQSFKNASRFVHKKVIVYSRKKKRNIAIWKRVRVKIKFVPGIYIVTLDKNLNVSRAEYVRNVVLDPRRYQNHQYLKNSYFAHETRDRAL
jgi:N-acetylmuramoyl-L-alanine amidase